MGQPIRQPAPYSPTVVTLRAPSVGVGPGRKFSPNTELILSRGWQPGLLLEHLLALCGFEVSEFLRAGDPETVTPEMFPGAICGGWETPSVCPEGTGTGR